MKQAIVQLFLTLKYKTFRQNLSQQSVETETVAFAHSKYQLLSVVSKEFKFHLWSVHRKCRTAVGSFWLEVRGFETLSFLDRRRISSEKKINMCAAILN